MANETSAHRAARAVQHTSDLTFQQARTMLGAQHPTPRLRTTVEAVTYLLEHAPSHLRAPAWPASIDVVITDDIGHTRDTYELADIPTTLLAQLAVTDPATELTWAAPEGGTWVVAAHIPTIEWADTQLSFAGLPGNPGCDECGTLDAVVRVDGTPLCVAGATRAGLVVPAELVDLIICDECEVATDGRLDMVNDQHAPTCSLNSANVTG